MDLRVMSPTSYQTALPRDGLFNIAVNREIVSVSGNLFWRESSERCRKADLAVPKPSLKIVSTGSCLLNSAVIS